MINIINESFTLPAYIDSTVGINSSHAIKPVVYPTCGSKLNVSIPMLEDAYIHIQTTNENETDIKIYNTPTRKL